MARKKSITQEHVNQICTTIAGEGEEPTLSTVRERLGGKGSFATIQPLLKNWKEESKENADLPPIPEKMEEIAQFAVNECWKFAVKLHRKESSSLKDLHNKELQESSIQLNESLAILDKETEKNEKLNLLNQELNKENKELETKIAHAQGRIQEMEKLGTETSV